MSQDELNHGPRLSGEEYDRAIVALYSDVPPIPSKGQEEELRRCELDLSIDYRLGKDFPQERREALWSIQKNLEQHRIKFMLKHFLYKFLYKSQTKEAKELANYVVSAYAKVLNEAELEQYFGKNEVTNPSLPIQSDSS